MFIPPKLGFDPAPNPVFGEEITNFPTLEPLECWKSPFSGVLAKPRPPPLSPTIVPWAAMDALMEKDGFDSTSENQIEPKR
jgi:hypothetical protein